MFVLVWISIDLWGKVYNNFAYQTLKLNPQSTQDSFLVASVWSALILFLILESDELKDFSNSVTGGEPLKKRQEFKSTSFVSK